LYTNKPKPKPNLRRKLMYNTITPAIVEREGGSGRGREEA
jgi:hypothetical protein